MSSRVLPAIAGAVLASLVVEAAPAQTVDELEQRILILERRLELDKEAQAAAAADAPAVAAGERGFSLRSRDGNNQIRLRGLIHFDSRSLLNDDAPDTSDTFVVQRIRPIIEGTVGGIYDFRFTPDFGNGRTVIQDAYVVARFRPSAQVTAGKFKTPFGIERLQSASDIRFFQRALPNNLVPNRDIGLQLGGDLFSGTLNYAAAYLNGVSDGASSEANSSPDNDNNNDKDYAVRLFAQPFKAGDNFALRGLGFGIAATYGDSTGTPARTLLSSYRSSGNTTFFAYNTGVFLDGERVRISPQAYYSIDSFGVLAEYVQVEQDVTRSLTPTTSRSDSLEHDAWQVSLGYFLTGEEQGYRSPAPKRPYAVGKEGWGAFELVARYSVLTLDSATFAGAASQAFANPLSAAEQASAWAVGVNWYLTRNVKAVLNYEQTTFDGGAATGDRPDEEALLGRIQVNF